MVKSLKDFIVSMSVEFKIIEKQTKEKQKIFVMLNKGNKVIQ